MQEFLLAVRLLNEQERYKLSFLFPVLGYKEVLVLIKNEKLKHIANIIAKMSKDDYFRAKRYLAIIINRTAICQI